VTQYEVAKISVTLNAPSAITIDGKFPTYAAPNSNADHIKGNDGCGAITTPKPAVGSYDTASTNTINTSIAGPPDRSSNYTGASPAINTVTSGTGSLSDTTANGGLDLTTIAGLNQLVTAISEIADYTIASGTPANLGTDASPLINVVTGDSTIHGTGAGVLLVQGNLVLDGNFNWDGLILVIGKGSLTRSGGGGGNINGAILVANTVNPTTDTPPQPGPPFYDTSGGGNSTIQYDSCLLDNALTSSTYKIISYRELTY